MKKTHRKRNIVIVVVLVVAAAMIMYPLVTVFGLFYDRPDCYISQFYKEPENTLDGVVVGSSAVYRYWAAPEAFDDYGMAVYCYGSVGTPAFAFENIIDSILKTQSPEFIAIDIRAFMKDPDSLTTGHCRCITSYMPASFERTGIIADFIKADIRYNASISKNLLDYAFPEFRDKAESAKVNVNAFARYKGFRVYHDNLAETKSYEPNFSEDSAELNYDYEEILNDFLTYCNGLDCKVIFVSTPAALSSDLHARLNGAIEIVENHGFDVIDMNTEEAVSEMGLDYSTDFHNARHTNTAGALKVTEYMAKIFDEKYDLPDHRGDSTYASWQKAADKLQRNK